MYNCNYVCTLFTASSYSLITSLSISNAFEAFTEIPLLSVTLQRNSGSLIIPEMVSVDVVASGPMGSDAGKYFK